MHQDFSLLTVNFCRFRHTDYLESSTLLLHSYSLLPWGATHAAKFTVMKNTSVLCLSVWRNDKSMQYILLLIIQCPKSGYLCYTNKVILPTHLFT